MIAGAAGRVYGSGVEEGADVAERMAQCRVAAGRPPAPTPSSAASRPRITRMVVDLPAPLGPTNPVTCPGADQKRDPIQGNGRSETLAEPSDFDGRFHANRRYEAQAIHCRHAGERSLS